MKTALTLPCFAAVLVLSGCNDPSARTTTHYPTSTINWTPVRAAQRTASANDTKALATLRKGPSCLRESGGRFYWFIPGTNTQHEMVCGTARTAYDQGRIMLILNPKMTQWLTVHKTTK